jgi:hypothetical protein
MHRRSEKVVPPAPHLECEGAGFLGVNHGVKEMGFEQPVMKIVFRDTGRDVHHAQVLAHAHLVRVVVAQPPHAWRNREIDFDFIVQGPLEFNPSKPAVALDAAKGAQAAGGGDEQAALGTQDGPHQVEDARVGSLEEQIHRQIFRPLRFRLPSAGD